MRKEQIKRLQEKAMFLRLLLEQYAKTDRDVSTLQKLMNPFLEQVAKGKLEFPQRYSYRWYFSNPESPLFGKYSSLSLASANFAAVLEEWETPTREDDRHLLEFLRERALAFRTLLEHYAGKDDAAKQLLTSMKQLLDDIDAGKVIPPIVNEYRWWFVNRESPLFNKYADLTEAASNYDADIEADWYARDRGAFGGFASKVKVDHKSKCKPWSFFWKQD